MTGQTCALPSCCKPLWPSVRQGASPPLTCGNLHHQLLMASRFNPVLPHPHQAILDRNAVGLCALRSCEKAPRLADPWCTEKHYLSWLKVFTSSLQPDQICMLPGCTRHVFVDDNGLPSRFCGWGHTQEFVMLNNVRQQYSQQGQLPAVEVSPQPPLLPASLNESEDGHLPSNSLNSLMHCFKQFVHSRIAPKNSRVIENFYEKHPWEVLSTEGHACWIIACPKFTIKKTRQWTTLEDYRWWRSGQPVKKSGYTVRYYKYIAGKRKEKEPDQQHAESSYTMQEYTLEGIETHTLIHLVKRKLFSKGEYCGNEQPGKPPIADQVDNIACLVEDHVNNIACPVQNSGAMFTDKFLFVLPQLAEEDLPHYSDMFSDKFPFDLPPLAEEDLPHYSSCVDPCSSFPNGSASYTDFHPWTCSPMEQEGLIPCDVPYSAPPPELLQGMYHIPS